MPLIRDALSAIGAVGRSALLGAVSGSVATTLIWLLPEATLGILEWRPGEWFFLSPFSLLPGLVFGLIIGWALYRGGHAGPRSFAAYVAASTVSYLAAVNLVFGIYGYVGSLWPTGMIGGLFGGACLTGLAAWKFTFVRRRKPVLLMLFAGGVLGSLLPLSDSFWGAMVFFAVWQAGYAAAFATALPEAA
jgi:uncharacterized membrane protein (UPF0136 family)